MDTLRHHPTPLGPELPSRASRPPSGVGGPVGTPNPLAGFWASLGSQGPIGAPTSPGQDPNSRPGEYPTSWGEFLPFWLDLGQHMTDPGTQHFCTTQPRPNLVQKEEGKHFLHIPLTKTVSLSKHSGRILHLHQNYCSDLLYMT